MQKTKLNRNDIYSLMVNANVVIQKLRGGKLFFNLSKNVKKLEAIHKESFDKLKELEDLYTEKDEAGKIKKVLEKDPNNPAIDVEKTVYKDEELYNHDRDELFDEMIDVELHMTEVDTEMEWPVISDEKEATQFNIALNYCMDRLINYPPESESVEVQVPMKVIKKGAKK